MRRMEQDAASRRVAMRHSASMTSGNTTSRGAAMTEPPAPGGVMELDLHPNRPDRHGLQLPNERLPRAP
jgi:hypothetical protein